ERPPARDYADAAEYTPSRLSVFFRMYRPERPGTLPAGLVLFILLGALVLAMFLNANSTFRKSNAKDKGEWRQSIAANLRNGSCALRLTVPHDRIDELRDNPTGCDNGSGVVADTRTPEQILADDRAEAAKQQGTDAAAPTSVPNKPQLRAPTADKPLN